MIVCLKENSKNFFQASRFACCLHISGKIS